MFTTDARLVVLLAALAAVPARADEQELRRLKDEQAKLEVEVLKQKVEILTLKAEAEKLRAEAIAAKVEAQVLKARNDPLTQMAAELQKQLAQIKAGDPTKAAPRPDTPVPEGVEGKVNRVDAKTNLATISIGSDAGLRQGHVLEVFRTEPAPKYLGQVKVVSVSAREAVVQPFGVPRGQELKPNDKVASRIQGR